MVNLKISGPGVVTLDLILDMSVDNKYIQQPVVIKIKESGPPTDKRQGVSEARENGDIIKKTVSFITIKGI